MVLKLHKIQIKEHETLMVSMDMMKAMPLSVYGNIPYEDIPECVDPIFQKPIPTDAVSSGNETDNYWPPDINDSIISLYIVPPAPETQEAEMVTANQVRPKRPILLRQEKGILPVVAPKWHIIKAKPVSGFKISVNGLKKRQPQYYFKCQIANCTKSFSALQDWNAHHCSAHTKVRQQCSQCPRKFSIPSTLQARISTAHLEKKFSCDNCDLKFAFKGTFCQHRRVHLKARIYKCFIAGCRKKKTNGHRT